MSQQQFDPAFAYGQGFAAPDAYGMSQNMTYPQGQGMNAPFDVGAYDNSGLPYGQDNQAPDYVGMPNNIGFGYGPNLAAPGNLETLDNQAFDFDQGNAAPNAAEMPFDNGMGYELPLPDPADLEPPNNFMFEAGAGYPAIDADAMGPLFAPFDTVNPADLRANAADPPPALPPMGPTPAAEQPEMAQQGLLPPAAAALPPPALPAAVGAFPAPQPAQPAPDYYPAPNNMAARQPGNHFGVDIAIPTNGAAVFGGPAPDNMVPAPPAMAQPQMGPTLQEVTPERRAELRREAEAERQGRKIGPRRPKAAAAPAPAGVEKKKKHAGPEKGREGVTQRMAWGDHTRRCGENDRCVADCRLKVYWRDVWEKEREFVDIVSDEGQKVHCAGLWSYRYRNRDQHRGKRRVRNAQA